MGVTVGQTSDVPPGDRLFVKVGDEEITVTNQDGEYYAFRNFCPHQEGPVGRGPIAEAEDWGDGPVVTCPYHGWTFDLESGQASFNPNRKIIVYDVHVDGKNIVVEM